MAQQQCSVHQQLLHTPATLWIQSAADSTATCVTSAHQSSSSPDMRFVPLTSWLASLMQYRRCASRSIARTRTQRSPPLGWAR